MEITCLRVQAGAIVTGRDRQRDNLWGAASLSDKTKAGTGMWDVTLHNDNISLSDSKSLLCFDN